MHTFDPGNAQHQFDHALADVARQFLVHQDCRAFPGDLQCTPQDVQRDTQAKQRIQLRPAVACQQQGQQDAAI
ncbi:hypothetical protein D3C76_1839020 [compost metagenome]